MSLFIAIQRFSWLALLVSFPALAAGAEGVAKSRNEVTATAVIEHAQFVRSGEDLPPAASAAWQEVALPHDWRLLPDGRRSDSGWYRITFDLGPLPHKGRALYLRNLRSWSVELFVNGTRLAGSADFDPPRTAADYSTPFYVFIPAIMLQPGENVLHIRLRGSSLSRNLHGLDRVHFGDAVRLSERQRRDMMLASESRKLAMAALFAAGFIALLLWLARRRDAVIFWFSVTCLSWPLAGAIVSLHWPDVGWLQEISGVYMRYGLPVPVLVLCLRIVDRRWPRVEALLWTYLVLELTYTFWVPAVYPEITGHWIVRVAWPTVSALLLFAGAVLIMVAAKRPLRWSHYLEIVGLAGMGVFLLQDLARYMNWIDLSPRIVRHWHAPVMLVALGVAIFERHVAQLWQIHRNNQELSKRVREAALEIDAYYAREQDSRRAAALAEERQRILEDMHDGMGARLVGMLHYVRSGHVDLRNVEREVQKALQELRMVVDSLQPRDGDLAAVLGSMRYRLKQTMDFAEIELRWDVHELPEIGALDPAAVLSIQRIVLEAVNNAIQHAGARHLNFTAQRCAQGVEVLIEDDGRGFDPANIRAGNGLVSMRARAERLGARIEISAGPGRGARVRIILPPTLSMQTGSAPETPNRRATLLQPAASA